jgi:hypothetical protein
MSHDPKNPVSNETGEYIDISRPVEVTKEDDSVSVRFEPEEKPAPKKTRRK